MRPGALRDEDGFTLMELMTAMTISLVILGAVLTSFTLFMGNSAKLVKTDEALGKTRLGVDRVAKQLRNLANPTASGSSIDRAEPYDFVFQTSDPSKRRVRYCLAESPGGARDVLWFQSASAAGPLTASMTAACPGTGWDKRSIVSDQIVNRIDGADRRLFDFGCSSAPTGVPWCAASSANYSRIISARLDVYLDINGSGQLPNAVRMSTAVYLRNQNEPPTAAIATPSTAGNRTVMLNASASIDPEGRTMEYQWFKGTDALAAPDCAGGPETPPGLIGKGVTLTHTFPLGDTSPQQIRLRVVDPGCLYAVAGPIAVNIP